MPLRKWPTDRFKKLAEQILDEYPDALVILTGAPREAAPAEKIRDEIGSKRVISFAGATTMPQLITLFGLCDVLVTNDSGPAHFASMTKIKNIVLFGPETPKLYGPIDGNPMPIWAGLACSPCINALNHRLSPCNNNLCMQVISVDEVMQKVRQSINGRQPGASFQQESTLPTGRYIAQSNIGGDAHVL
jgi:ADP-heptose:LPS heptosyltransferase